MLWQNWILSVYQDTKRKSSLIGSPFLTQKFLVCLMWILFTLFNTKVLFAVSDSATMESMLLLVATDLLRFSTSLQGRRSVSYKMKV